jgi:hypothetical protein
MLHRAGNAVGGAQQAMRHGTLRMVEARRQIAGLHQHQPTGAVEPALAPAASHHGTQALKPGLILHPQHRHPPAAQPHQPHFHRQQKAIASRVDAAQPPQLERCQSDPAKGIARYQSHRIQPIGEGDRAPRIAAQPGAGQQQILPLPRRMPARSVLPPDLVILAQHP